MRGENFGCLLITHYQRLLDHIKPDFVHIMMKGRIVKSGGPELIERIANKNPHLMLKDVERIVAVVFDKITNSLANGDRVEFRGFGAFSVRTRTPRIAKNPRTGEQVKVEERNIPHFKTGKQLFELLNKK